MSVTSPSRTCTSASSARRPLRAIRPTPQRHAPGQAGEPKYLWSSFGPATPLARMVEYAHRRWGVEPYHEEAKGELGWDQFQGRRWDAVHRNAVTVMLTYSFLPDRRRRPLPSVHRTVADWLQQAALRDLVEAARLTHDPPGLL